MISDQTIGTAPKSRMITTAGVTNAQPVTGSARLSRAIVQDPACDPRR